MKKKIIIGLSIFTLFFLIGGIYIISTIQTATSTLDNLITLHQVEIIREHLLLQIKRVQADISYKNTRHARGIDTVVENVRNLERVGETCFDCHHSREMLQRLIDLRNEIKEYKTAVSRVFTVRANVARLEAEEDRAYKIGKSLLSNVNNMIILASSKLESRTQSSLEEIARTNIILYILVSLGPVSVTILAIFFIKGFTRPIDTLQHATRKLRDGNLDYRIQGLKDEFGEVAESFNEMSASLKEHMHKIQESENRYRTLFESAGDAIFIMEAEGKDAGRILSANRAAAEMHGYTVEELIKLNVIKDLDTPEAAKYSRQRIEHILRGEWLKAEITHRKKDGKVFPVEMHAGLLQYMGQKYILAFERDISERIEAEKALRESEERFRNLVEATNEWIWEVNENAVYTYVSPKVRDILGYEPEEVLGKSPFDLMPPEEAGRVAGIFGPIAAVRKAFNELENVNLHKDGRPVVLETSGVPFFDADGFFRGYRGVDRDITERKKIHETLQRAEQMKIVGEWAAGLVHEIKNPLAGIKGSVELLAEELPLTENDKTIINRTVNEIQRIESLLKSLLNYARPPKPEFHTISINDILDKTVAILLRQPSLSPSNVKIEVLKDFDKNLPETKADPLHLQQVFMNLISNAIESMHNGGVLSVRTSFDAGANATLIDISDTGKGIDEKVMNKIFQPFFTTKPRGTGLGLAITKRLVELHGGRIQAENKKDGGALFHISLPVRPEKEAAKA